LIKEVSNKDEVKWTMLQKFYAKVLKRILDLFFGILIFVLLIPLFLIMPLVIRLDTKGETIFKQKRLGQNGKEFWIYKYRSMVTGAEKQGSGVYSFKGDTRVTKVGNFIRKTSIDEIPQIINIIKGEMSFIGPRPTLTYHPWKIDDYSEFQKLRFLVKPGITGLAQTKGRKELEWTNRIKFDIEYIEYISVYNDIKLLFITVFRVIAMKDNENVSKTNNK
jgi:undecaprenyl phosphate N,N'-diacetylbacillosamine 1-phosphate transferase